MLWINFLHFYQPANIESYKIKEALDKSYSRLVRLMEEHQELKMTWNISGCLWERLADAGENDFIRRVKLLAASGRLELVSSAAYHALLPLVPVAETVRQIKENETILKKYLGSNFKARGFFLPEMAYSPEVAVAVKKAGYDWIIVDEGIFPAGQKPDSSHHYRDRASGLSVIFRNRRLSSAYPPDQLLAISQDSKNNKGVYITATDAELYGLRHQDPTAEMEKIVALPITQTLTISEYLDSLSGPVEELELRAGTWESSEADISQGRAYELWSGHRNLIQRDLWKLARLALKAGAAATADSNFFWYRWHLVRGLASCTFWWASGRDFSNDFGPYAWSPDDIERGLDDLVRSVRSLNSPDSLANKLKVEKYYLKIKKRIWREHWRKHWPKIRQISPHNEKYE